MHGNSTLQSPPFVRRAFNTIRPGDVRQSGPMASAKSSSFRAVTWGLGLRQVQPGWWMGFLKGIGRKHRENLTNFTDLTNLTHSTNWNGFHGYSTLVSSLGNRRSTIINAKVQKHQSHKASEPKATKNMSAMLPCSYKNDIHRGTWAKKHVDDPLLEPTPYPGILYCQ